MNYQFLNIHLILTKDGNPIHIDVSKSIDDRPLEEESRAMKYDYVYWMS
jgi:hypothetical protein